MDLHFAQHQNELDVQHGGLMFDNQPFTGSLHREASNTTGEAICHYQNGKKNGIFKEWYPGGTIKEVSMFRDDELHGRRICYWPNGTTRFHVNYSEGEMDGVYEEFADNGITKQIKTYYKGNLIRVRKSLLGAVR